MIFRDTNKCDTYSGGTLSKTTGENATVNGGVDLGVVHVSAQSGWNSSSSVSWTIHKKTRICGNSPLGWAQSASRIAEAHTY
ncbi:hypothetical protein IL992_05225 [Microbispora sp. NEAU-D428]|uniref:hypothetical protein n=1 Tax=Microbispora sitophila TaxID=2771537 RepID=UPI00186668F5|nr:hypothetical protein [Microbispora sitophila]MBE3008589.1 hypothetical protein [Microbispora sitophila]